KDKLKKNRGILCAFGGVATLVIYGGLVNMSSLFMVTSTITLGGILAVYGAGFYFDLVHALSTVVFLFFISKPMIEKLDRIKVKYGLIE
ncbi:MAG TPA: ECF transporter S component, partial [Clostridium sp.]